MLLLGVVCLSLKAQTYTREGNTFISTKTSSSNAIQTNYTWSDGTDTYPIWINTTTGSCFVYRTSKKSGKQYKSYLKEDVCIEICREMNIQYKPKPKKDEKERLQGN